MVCLHVFSKDGNSSVMRLRFIANYISRLNGSKFGLRTLISSFTKLTGVISSHFHFFCFFADLSTDLMAGVLSLVGD